MRTLNLKLIGAILFAIVFFVSGFFINTSKVDALETQSFPYSLSLVTSYTNTDGGISTVLRVGCLAGSGDVYDINKGTLCPYITSTARIGCISGSNHKYDINTGALCLYGVSNVRIGCAIGSPHKYDINTGNICTNKPIKVSSTPKISVNPTNIISGATTTTATTPPEKEGPGETKITVDPVNPILSPNELAQEPILTEETSENIDGIIADEEKIGSLFTWPLSVPTILLIIVILSGVVYGVYSFLKKEPVAGPKYVEKKEKKAEVVKPIVIQQQPQKPLEQPVNTNPNPQNKIPNTPMTPPQNPNPTQQIPLDIPNNSGPF